jgi:PncC family amidohydrolase
MARRVAAGLLARGQTVAAAESCTGGLLCAALTSLPGSSAYFLGGVVGYANDVKRSALGVPAAVLARKGAVSAECALRMAAGVRRRLGADVGVAITGIAGPGGGTRSKPVGLVFVGVAAGGRCRARRFRFRGGRARVRRAACLAALGMLDVLFRGAGKGRRRA